MATQRHVVLICDVCTVEDKEGSRGIKTHQVLVDGKATELEACEKCWKKHGSGLEKLVEVGRKIPRKKVA